MPDAHDNLQPMDSAANRSKGLVCPDCKRPLHGRIPKAARRKMHKRGRGQHKGHVCYTVPKPGYLARVRQCPHCGNRCLTREEIVSNRV